MSKTVWLISPFDSIPGESWGYKHSLYVVEALQERGFEVIYWSSSFSHALKIQRSIGFEERIINSKFKIRLIPCSSYSNHIGFARLKSMFDFAWGTLKYGWKDDRPCCIVAPLTSLFSDLIVVKLSKKFKSPLITDLRDLWPEIFINYLTGSKKLFKYFLFPLFKVRKYALKNSSGFTSVCETYKLIAFKQVENLKNIPSAVVYSTGIDMREFAKLMEDNSRDAELITKSPQDFWVIYAGTIGSNYDIDTLLDAAVILKFKSPELKILVAGNGPKLDYLKKFVVNNKLDNVEYLGVLDRQILARYYAMSDVGLSIYGKSSTVAIPAKIFDYYMSGLPIVNSVEGELSQFIKDNGLGFQYKAGDALSLSATLSRIMNDPIGRLNMKKNLSKISMEFDKSIQYAKLANIVEKVLDVPGVEK